MSRLTSRAVVLGMLCSLAAVGSAAAAPLKIGQAGEISSVDPHFQNNRYNNSARQHVYEALTAQDSALKLQPRLATSWRKLDEVTWEFKLRPGVKFHNGAPFTAADVIYSLCRVPEIKDSPSSFKAYLSGISAVTAPDPLTLQIKTEAPAPQLPADLSLIGVISAQGASLTYKPSGCDAPSGGWPTRADFDGGKLSIGTGPYTQTAFRRGQRLTLARSPGYWGAAPIWDQVELLTLVDEAQRVAALLAKDVDMIEEPGLQDLEDLAADPALVVTATPSTRVIYLALDTHQEPSPGVTGADGKNPLKDRRVREALSKAIDRTAMVNQLLFGQATPVGQLVAPGVYGYNPALTPIFDPAAAKALLAEAGYPNGFDLVLNGPNDRYVQDEQILGVVAIMLKDIGVRAVAQPEPGKSFFERRNKFELSVFLSAFNPPNADTALKLLIAGRNPKLGLGSGNYGRYANPAVDALITQALAVADDAAREPLLQAAGATAMQDVAVIPLHAEKAAWALRKGLRYAARPDQFTIAMEVTPAP